MLCGYIELIELAFYTSLTCSFLCIVMRLLSRNRFYCGYISFTAHNLNLMSIPCRCNYIPCPPFITTVLTRCDIIALVAFATFCKIQDLFTFNHPRTSTTKYADTENKRRSSVFNILLLYYSISRRLFFTRKGQDLQELVPVRKLV